MIKPRLKKNFWRKMIATNCLFLIFIVAVFTAIRYHTIVTTNRKNIQNQLTQFADTNTSQFQLIFDNMSRLTLNIAISDVSKEILKNANNYYGTNNYFESAQSERRDLMYTIQQMAGSQMTQNSISIISTKGDYVFLDIHTSLILSREEMSKLSKMDDFNGTHAYKFISKSPTDSYGRSNSPTFSYARKISNAYESLGYVEFQKPFTALDSIFNNNHNPFEIASVITLEDEIFYSSNQELLNANDLLPTLKENRQSQNTSIIHIDHDSYLLYCTFLSEYGFSIYTLLPESYYTQIIWKETELLIAQSVLLLFAMLILILQISKQIYKPVRDLRHKMENLELDNITSSSKELSKHADEIELFNHVFAEMVNRIQQQKDKLLQQNIRELQISYQALQAQVSPHFLYNTLYLIGLKGEEHDVPEILDMCSCLTHMMGYCVDLKQNLVPLAFEIQYMNNYLQLMKYRYLDKLQYELDIEDSVKCLSVPKFILQPLVENCFTHGFKNCAADKYIIHFSLKSNENTWTLLIEDNGNGFSKEDEQRVLRDISLVKESVENPNAKFVNEITGIGLINTYARLFISFSKHVTLRIGTSQLSGGLIEITCPISTDSPSDTSSSIFFKET